MAGRILVLDDEEHYAEMLQDLLRQHNYRVDIATRPERAIDQLEAIPYDLVISDFKMPVMDGADFLKKSRELYPNLPFILVSGLMNTPELVKVANMSVTLVMEKPLDTKVFLGHVARFSQPMTDEERDRLESDVQSDGADGGEAAASYPEEPRFFSAVSTPAKRFMQKAWAIASAGSELFVCEPLGGDMELAAKDISQWRGDGDRPISSFDLPASNEEAVETLRALLAEPDQSTTVCIRLASPLQVAQAKKLTELVQREVEDAAKLLLVYVLAADSAGDFLNLAGEPALILPKITDRPSDLASYARRFARMASERSGKKHCADFTPESAYLLLAHGWTGGYRQIQDVVTKAVASSEADEPITVASLQEALGIEAFEDVAPDSRLARLMKIEQQRFFEQEMEGGALTASALARTLELDRSIRTREDLQSMPLVRADLAIL